MRPSSIKFSRLMVGRDLAYRSLRQAGHRAGLMQHLRLLWRQGCVDLPSLRLAAGVACWPQLQRPLRLLLLRITHLAVGAVLTLTAERAPRRMTVLASASTVQTPLPPQQYLQLEAQAAAAYQHLRSTQRLRPASLCTSLQVHRIPSTPQASLWSCCTAIGTSEHTRRGDYWPLCYPMLMILKSLRTSTGGLL